MQLIGHRGAAGLAPENSLEGFRLAVELKLWAVEFDVQVTRDGVPVLMHDKLLERTTSGAGYTADISFVELEEVVRLKNGERVPSLADVLDILSPAVQMRVYLEITSPHAGLQIAEAARARLSADRLVISSFHHPMLLALKERFPDLRTQALFECAPVDPVGLVQDACADEAGVSFHAISDDLVYSLQGAGIPVYAFTVNDHRDVAKARAMNLDGIFTDYPEARG